MRYTNQVVKPLEIRPMESNKPFDETLRSLMEMADIGSRELTKRVEALNWGSLGTIGRLTRGEAAPSHWAMEFVARAMQVPPETFAEYRLSCARQELDPGVVGLEAALKRLAEIEDR